MAGSVSKLDEDLDSEVPINTTPEKTLASPKIIRNRIIGATMSFAFSRRLLKPAIFIAVLLGLAWLGHFGYRG